MNEHTSENISDGLDKSDSDHETDVSGISVDGETLVSPVVSSTGERHELPWAHLAHYEIVGRIGHGGMGDVYKGFEQSLNRTVAIKVLPTDLARDADFVRRFYAEASSAARVVHPNVIPIHFIGEDQGCHFFAMQYVEGESLAGLLSTRGKLSVNDALDLIEQVLAGLGAAHQHQLIHRDIKPGNILLDSKHRRAILADFGLVKSLHGDQLNTATGVVMGTVDYISPEQGRGQAVDHRSDLYSVGVLLYQVLSGQLPFTADSPTALIFQHVYERPQSLREVVPDVPESLNAVVAKLMAKSPADRYSSTESVLEDLCAVRAETALPSQADLVLRANPNAYSRLADKSGSPGTLIISAPDFSEEPWFPEELSEAEVKPKNWWVKFRSRFGAVVQEYAPEMVDRWANTQQQVDFAVVEYERRQQRLAALVAEAEAVLEELHTQETEWRNVSQQAGDTAIRTAGELQEAIAAQSDQLDSMQLQLAKVNTTLATLQSQRNILNARLKAANGNARKENRKYLSLPISLLVLGVLIVSFMISISLKNDQPNASQSLKIEEVVESPTLPAPKKVSHALIKTEINLQPLFTHPLESSELMSFDFNSESNFMTLVKTDGTVELRDTRSGKLLREISTEIKSAKHLAIGSSGFRLITVDPLSQVMKTWNVQTGNFVESKLSEPASPLLYFDEEDNDSLVLLNQSAELTRFTKMSFKATGDRSILFETEIPAIDVEAWAFQPQMEWVAATISSHVVLIHALHEGHPVNHEFTSPEPVTSIAFHPTEPLLAIGTAVGTTFLYDIETQSIVSELTGHSSAVSLLSFDSTNRRLATASQQAVHIWDLSLRYVRKVIPAHDSIALDFSSDGQQLAIAERSSGIRFFDMKFPAIDKNVTRFQLPSTAENATEIETAMAIEKNHAPKNVISYDGRLRAVTQSDNQTAVVDVKTGETLHHLEMGCRALCLTISPDDKYLATGSFNSERYMGDVRIWNLRSGREVKRFIGHVHYAWSLAFSPDSQHLLSGGRGTMHLWDVKNGEELDRFIVPFPSVRRVAFSSNGKRCIAFDGKGIWALFDLQSGDLLLKVTGGKLYLSFLDNKILCEKTYGLWNTISKESTDESFE